MKRFALMFVSALICLCGCEKADVDINKLYGAWDECYDDKNFVMDGIVEYTFNADGTYQVYTYDALSGMTNTRTHEYTLKDNVITLNTANTDSSYSTSYTITKLNSSEMAWQKVGTSYSPGSNGSDYKHFKRK